jgi:hypothetical protein
MRIAPWSALLCCLAAPSFAQGVPVSFEEPQPVTVTGFAVGTVDYDHAANTNSFVAGKIAVALFKPVGDVYFFGQLTTALEDGEPGTEIDNLVVSWTPHTATRWSVALGRFDAPVGFERDDEPLNLLPTNSFNFEFARPVKLTGVITRYTASPRLQVAAAVTNGWDVTVDNNRGKTGLLRADWLVRDGLTLGVAGMYGPEQDGTSAHQRTLFSSDITVDAGRLVAGAEVNLGSEQDDPANATWSGGALTLFYRLGRTLGLAARYDILDDPDGSRTGIAQTLSSVTIGPMWFWRRGQEGIFANIEHTTFHLPQVAIRTAVRFDHSTADFFPTADGGLEASDTRAIVEVLYLF